jgi:hypothetical protein
MQKFLSALLLWMLSTGVLAASGSLLVYRVWEQGIDPYISRVIVTPDYVRLDEGAGGGGYTLFDRQQEILYNVSMEDRSVLVMNPTELLPQPSDGLILQEDVKVDDQAPEVAGRRPSNVRLLANGELCAELVVIDGVMEDAVEGLVELKLVLARIQAATLESVPLAMRTPCDLAMNVHAADRALRFGLPLQERSEGRSQSLIDFTTDFEVDEAMFALPAEFARRPMFAPGAI